MWPGTSHGHMWTCDTTAFSVSVIIASFGTHDCIKESGERDQRHCDTRFKKPQKDLKQREKGGLSGILQPSPCSLTLQSRSWCNKFMLNWRQFTYRNMCILWHFVVNIDRIPLLCNNDLHNCIYYRNLFLIRKHRHTGIIPARKKKIFPDLYVF